MTLVDANVLLYAVDPGATHHSDAKTWLDRALNGTETVLIPWLSLLAFLRLVTHPSVFEHPLPLDDALGVVDLWLDQPTVICPDPDARHITRLRELLATTGRGGNLVNDAHLAALAVQYSATVITFDGDFGRFPGVRWQRPAG